MQGTLVERVSIIQLNSLVCDDFGLQSCKKWVFFSTSVGTKMSKNIIRLALITEMPEHDLSMWFSQVCDFS